MQVVAAILIVVMAGAHIRSEWIYWTRMYPYMESRGVLPRKWLWRPLWLYKRTCLADNRSLKDWDEYWIWCWITIVCWAIFAVSVCAGVPNNQRGTEW